MTLTWQQQALSGEAAAEGSSNAWVSAARCSETGPCVNTCSHRHRCSSVLGGAPSTAGRHSTGPDYTFQNPRCVYTYRIPERDRRPTELSPWPCHFTDGVTEAPREGRSQALAAHPREGPGSKPNGRDQACHPLLLTRPFLGSLSLKAPLGANCMFPGKGHAHPEAQNNGRGAPGTCVG